MITPTPMTLTAMSSDTRVMTGSKPAGTPGWKARRRMKWVAQAVQPVVTTLTVAQIRRSRALERAAWIPIAYVA